MQITVNDASITKVIKDGKPVEEAAAAPSKPQKTAAEKPPAADPES
jgi:hypothetical protein